MEYQDAKIAQFVRELCAAFLMLGTDLNVVLNFVSIRCAVGIVMTF